MKIVVYDEWNNKEIATADVDFSLDSVFINSCDGMPIDDLHNLINKKSHVSPSYESDNIILKTLNLFNKKYEFGRMDEACMLYGILTNFSLSGDGISIYPLNDEYVSMIAEDSRYSNIYIWRKRQ